MSSYESTHSQKHIFKVIFFYDKLLIKCLFIIKYVYNCITYLLINIKYTIKLIIYEIQLKNICVKDIKINSQRATQTFIGTEN